VIVASNIMAKHMIDDFKVPFERVRLIPRGVDLSRFSFHSPSHRPGGEFTIGMVSRITPLKGHADFIRAVSVLKGKIPGLKAVMVGSAPKKKYLDSLVSLARSLGLSKTAEFTGARKDVPQVMHSLDVLVSATVTPEAFGRVIIEAQAAGVPVVATRVGGVVDIIDHGVNGLLCEPSDHKEMAARVLELYRDRPLAERIAAEGRKTVERDFNLDAMMTKTVAVYEEALKRINILVIKMSAIGDVILSVPSLQAIRARFSDADIKVLTGVASREALGGCPYINDMIVADLKGRDAGLPGIWRVGAALRRRSFDIVIDLQNNRASHILAALSMAPLRYGYDNGKFSFLLNRAVKDDAPYLDPIEHQFRVLRCAGIKPQEKILELWPSDAAESHIEKFLNDNWVKDSQELVGINVRASSRWLTKNWPPAHIAELCDLLAKELNIRAVLTGSGADADYARAIARTARSKPVIAAGRTDLMELASLIRRFKVFVTPDSAPMHIASAVGTPFVALFGPTDPKRHMPPSRQHVILKADVKCSPCYSPHCLKDFRCMRKITVGEVLAAVKSFCVKKEP
jgi:3-deoxy-D-manno-octulosonic-acid transferase/heptosyltransferase-1